MGLGTVWEQVAGQVQGPRRQQHGRYSSWIQHERQSTGTKLPSSFSSLCALRGRGISLIGNIGDRAQELPRTASRLGKSPIGSLNQGMGSTFLG